MGNYLKCKLSLRYIKRVLETPHYSSAERAVTFLLTEDALLVAAVCQCVTSGRKDCAHDAHQKSSDMQNIFVYALHIKFLHFCISRFVQNIVMKNKHKYNIVNEVKMIFIV